MNLTDYTYDLPEERIAVYPPAVRGGSRLLVLSRSAGSIKDAFYKDVANFLQPGDLLIINNTKVIKARLEATTADGKQRELLLLERHGEQLWGHTAQVMYRGKLRVDERLKIGLVDISVKELFGDGTALVSSSEDLLSLSEKSGTVPLPPYLHRQAENSDNERYQTVFAKEQGSVAAPTASLNMTDDILTSVKQHGVTIAELTLHVGLGTFMPIRENDITKHHMHEEYFVIPKATVELIRTTKQEGGRVIALGTTVTRALEASSDYLLSSQPAETTHGEAAIFIYPGYQFQIIEGLLTNFHAPNSTVLMMAAAFAGWDHLKSAYEHAVNEQYQFLSYGDSMLII